MNRIVYFLLIASLIIPISVIALNGSFDVNKSNITIELGQSDSFVVSASNATGKVTFSSNNQGICTIDQSSVWLDKDSITVNVRGVGVGNCVISININGGSYDETPIIETKRVNVKVNAPKSSDNTLRDLKIDGATIPGFSSNTTSYTIENHGNSINIEAITNDSKAIVSGTGTKSLNNGNNSFNIIVIAENGSQRTYNIIVNKPDQRSNNNNLKELSVNKGTIKFDKNNTNYEIKVDHNVDSIVIRGTAEDNKASVTGTGTKSLNDYLNEFQIVVKAENESTKTYIIRVYRKDAQGNYEKLSEDSSVKEFTITNYDIPFNNDTKKYNILIEEDVKELEIKVIPNDSKAKVSIENNKSLKAGLNKIKVIVTAENGNKNEFLLNVYKMGESKETCPTTSDSENNKKINSKIHLWMIIAGIELLIITVISIISILRNRSKKSNIDETKNTTIELMEKE